MFLRSRLLDDRTKAGELRIESEGGAILWGPVPCLGKADNAGALAHNNPQRNPEFPYGDHPLGTYIITGWAPTGNTPDQLSQFGAPGKLVLDPLTEQALARKLNGGYGLLIHSGAIGGPYPYGFRPTYGCLRLLERDMRELVELWRKSKVEGHPLVYYTAERY